MLCLTFVPQCFKSRWAGMETGGELAYALNMFIGLIVFNLFNECVALLE